MFRIFMAYFKFFLGCALVFTFLLPSILLCCGIILMKNSLAHNEVHRLVEWLADRVERFLDWFDDSL